MKPKWKTQSEAEIADIEAKIAHWEKQKEELNGSGIVIYGVLAFIGIPAILILSLLYFPQFIMLLVFLYFIYK